MTNEEIKTKLKTILNEKRYIHSLGVADTAKKLAHLYGEDENLAYTCGLLHDCAKNLSPVELIQLCQRFKIEITDEDLAAPNVLHSFVGAYIAQTEYGIDNEKIFSGIYNHTMGKENMPLFDKIIFVADMIEPSRGDGEYLTKIRRAAEYDINLAARFTYDYTIEYLLKKEQVLNTRSVMGRNFLITQEKANE